MELNKQLVNFLFEHVIAREKQRLAKKTSIIEKKLFTNVIKEKN